VGLASGAKELLGVGIIDPGFGQYQGLIKAKKAKSDFELRESFVAVLFSLFFFRCFFFSPGDRHRGHVQGEGCREKNDFTSKSDARKN